ncbi:MAG TPA: hypothetical protein VMH35_00040, partial [Streptosporangiaceae bacterium]|nr:hypothetical protein [Streptosporangiaceae bacterium]
ERMPVLVDDDLLFEDGPGAPRPAVAVNRWLRELPASGCPAPGSWESYARVVKGWSEFLALHGVSLFDSRERLKAALGKYAGYRAAGPPERRFAATTWGRHMSVLSLFYRWAMDEGYAQAEPFTYRMARALFAGTGRTARVNLAVRRTPKPHVTIKYLEPDFTSLFLNGLRGLAPDGGPDPHYRGRELARNAAIGELALATGMRAQEFSSLLSWEIPPLPPAPTKVPVPFPVPAAVAKGRKFRITWISYEALAAVHHYLEVDRPATTSGTAWRPPRNWGEPLLVTDPDARGGRVNGVRRRWETLTPAERRRLVAPGGGTCILAAKAGGGPFTAWASLFERTADRIRARYEPRFPHVFPHRLRHSFSMRTQMGRIAFDASFGSSREHALPAAQRAALRWRQPAGRHGGCGDLGLHGPPGPDATTMQLMPLRGLHHRCGCWHRDTSGCSRRRRMHHGVPGEWRRGGRGRCADPGPLLATRGLTWGCTTLVAAGARMWRLIRLCRMFLLLQLMHWLAGGAGARDGEGRGVGCVGAGGRRDAAAARGRAVRGDAGGLAAPAGGAAADRPADRRAGPAGAPVRGVHRGVAVAVDAGAGGAVGGLGRVGAFDGPLV